ALSRVEAISNDNHLETKVYAKSTNTGLLLHYQSHVDRRYKRSLITTMLNRAFRLLSLWEHFVEECERLKNVFVHLKYPLGLVDSVISGFVDKHDMPVSSTVIIMVMIIINMIRDNQIYMISLDWTRDKVLDSEDKVPDAEDKVPDAEYKVPGGEDKVSRGEDKVPGRDDKVPRVDKVPGDEENVPGGEEKVPSRTMLLAGRTRFLAVRRRFMANKVPGALRTRFLTNNVPGGEDKVPGGEDNNPGGENKVPGGEYKVPGGENKVPGVEDKVPGGEDKVPGDEENVPGGENKVPGGEYKVPGGENKVPGVEDKVAGVVRTRFLACSWRATILALTTRFLAVGTRFLLPGGGYKVPGGGTRILADNFAGGEDKVPGAVRTRYLALRARLLAFTIILTILIYMQMESNAAALRAATFQNPRFTRSSNTNTTSPKSTTTSLVFFLPL
ncbi:Hypothetical predicted protein, partial [Paramuricea clavata]